MFSIPTYEDLHWTRFGNRISAPMGALILTVEQFEADPKYGEPAFCSWWVTSSPANDWLKPYLRNRSELDGEMGDEIEEAQRAAYKAAHGLLDGLLTALTWGAS